MSEAKIHIQVGSIEFSGEGEGKWVSDQLDKVFKEIPTLVKVAPVTPAEPAGKHDAGAAKGAGTASHTAAGTLAAYLKEKKATTNQTRKFLATAEWIHSSDPKKEHITTSDVVKALDRNRQTALKNPSQCLNNNVEQGFCQKDSKNKKLFYVTDDGRAELGE